MINKEKAREAIRMLLEAVGEDVTREGLRDTPDRVARMYEEILAGMDMDPHTHLSRQFNDDTFDGSDSFVLEKDIEFHSMCEHHMMPFFGKVHIAYIPSGSIVGLSKLCRTVEVFARRLQVQERLTAQIADAIMDELAAKGVFVMIEAEHTCMTMRGVKKVGCKTVTLCKRGVFKEMPELEERALNMINGR